MSYSTLTKHITINASSSKVWEILFTDKPYRIWAAVFSPDSYFQTDWQNGSKAVFTDGSGYGLIGKIVENIPNKLLKIEYTGQLVKSEEDYTSEDVLTKIAGSTENYTLKQTENTTELLVEITMYEKWSLDMSPSWDKAIIKIKQLAEEK